MRMANDKSEGELCEVAVSEVEPSSVILTHPNPKPKPNPNPNPKPNLCEVDVFEGARHGPYEYNGWAGFHKALILALALALTPALTLTLALALTLTLTRARARALT